MKNIRIINYQFLIGIILAVFVILGCTEQNELGIEILPKDDLITVENTIVKESISAFTFTEDTIKTDESSSSLLGSFSDPTFGNTTINYATQFRLQYFPDFGENAVADSIKLILRYSSVYGDTTTDQTFKVYELISDIDIDNNYNQQVDLKSLASDFLLGERTYLPIIEKDTTGTYLIQQILSIPLDISLGEKLINADSAQLVNNDMFLEFFKGLYIETEKITNDGGAILTLNELTTSDYLGTGLVLYYNNDENNDENNVEEPDTMFMPLLVSEFSARVNSIKHDYSNTPFEDNLNSELVEDSLIYVQATGGLKSRILIEDLETWKDSINTAINKAELIFEIDTIASDYENFAPPSQLLFTVVDEDGNEFLPIDYVFDPDYYGGVLNEDYTYRFNITQHLQEIIDGSADNYGFFLTPANKNNEAKRVVLKGSKSTTGIKLVITYSKYTISL